MVMVMITFKSNWPHLYISIFLVFVNLHDNSAVKHFCLLNTEKKSFEVKNEYDL